MKNIITSLNVSLSQKLKKYVHARVHDGGFSTPSDYVRNLIRDDQERRWGKLERDLLDGINSGTSTKDLDDISRNVLKRLNKGA